MADWLHRARTVTPGKDGGLVLSKPFLVLGEYKDDHGAPGWVLLDPDRPGSAVFTHQRVTFTI